MNSKKIMDETPVDKSIILIKYGESEILANQDLCLIKGTGGSGKSRTVMNLVIGFSGKNDGLGFDYNILPKDKYIHYFSTEMADYHIKKRRLAVSDITGSKFSDNFICWDMRGLDSKSMIADIKEACNTHSPYLVIIDQIADFVESVNDEIASKDLYYQFDKIKLKYGCGMIFLMHQNEDSASNSKARGHLGSIFEQKCSSSLVVYKKKADFAIKSTKVREGQNILINAEYDNTTTFLKSKKIVKILTLKELLNELRFPCKASELDNQISIIEKCSIGTARNRKNELINNKLIGYKKDGRNNIFYKSNPISFNKIIKNE